MTGLLRALPGEAGAGMGAVAQVGIDTLGGAGAAGAIAILGCYQKKA